MNKQFAKLKKTAAAGAACLLLASILSGCQPTPEEAVVIQRSTDPLVTEAPATDATDAPLSPFNYEAPETYSLAFTGKDENVAIIVDAAVGIPGMGPLSVVELETGEVSLDFIAQAADVLFEGRPMFEPKVQMTRPEIEEEILELEEFMTPANMEEYYEGDRETIAYVKELFENRIGIFETMYRTAPETYVPTPAELEFKPMKYYEEQWLYEEMMQEMEGATDDQSLSLQDEYDNGQKIVLDAELPEGMRGRIEGYNYVNDNYHSHSFSFSRGNKEEYRGQPVSVLGVTPFSQEEAVTLALQTLHSLGIDYMYAADVWANSNPPEDPDTPMVERGEWVEPNPDEVYSYNITFLPLVGDAPVLYSYNYNDGLYMADEYGPYYGGEMASVTVDEKGVSSIRWEYPLKQTAVKATDVQILPFDQIMDRFRHQMELTYTLHKAMGYDSEEARQYLEEDEYMKEYMKRVTGVEITIDTIRLGMARVPIKDRPGVYEYIPAWKFYGNHVVLEEGADTQEQYVAMPDGQSYTAYLALSAIDGSVLP